MSLVYNNGKPIGRCESFDIETVQGTSDFIKMKGFEMKQPNFSKSQQEYFDWLKEEWGEGQRFLNQFMEITTKKTAYYVVARLDDHELAAVWKEFLSWVASEEDGE